VTPSARHRPAAVAGLFYPEDRAALRAEVRAHLAAARPLPGDARPPKLIVVPHAGTAYSGAIAAQAFAWLGRWPGRWRRVVLLAPAHRVFVEGLAAPSAAAFDTPLGAVPVDRAALDALAGVAGAAGGPSSAGAPAVAIDDRVHAHEHAIEVQLPFLQVALGEFTLVPLAVGDAAPAAVAAVIERLWDGDETLIVISTDLSHGLPYARARAVDAATIERVLALDGTLAHDQACGATPLNAALAVAARHRLRPRLLDLRNSGDTAGERARVVGYAALVLTE
jgi:AmmeMemoRadiSam system protein B